MTSQNDENNDTTDDGQGKRPAVDAKLQAQIELIVGAGGIPGATVYPPDWVEAGLDYVYRANILLMRDEDLPRVQPIVAGTPIRRAPDTNRATFTQGASRGGGEIGGEPGLRGLTMYRVADTNISIQDHCQTVDDALGVGVVTPDHLLYMVPATSCCPATEPESVRPGATPVPAALPSSHDGEISVHILDSGWLVGAENEHWWLHGVDGDPEDPYFTGAGHGPDEIKPYAGHGTFCAGVLRSVAPKTDVYVEKTFWLVGGVFESDIAAQMLRAVGAGADVVSLSAGTYTRSDLPPLGFEVVRELVDSYKGVVLVCAAGNDSGRAPFWPAALDWTVSVGALSTDWQQRAWFSNYGAWVDCYAPGEDLVNAYAHGTFTCVEPPNTGQVRAFDGMARWSGTSFSTPLVAGLIAARMSRTGENGKTAAAALLREARENYRPGVGPVLLPGHDDECGPRPHRHDHHDHHDHQRHRHHEHHDC